MNKITAYFSIFALCLVLLASPLAISAQFNVGGTPPPTSIPSPVQGVNPIVNIINGILNSVVWPITATLVIILFILAGFSFLTSKGEPGKLELSRNYLIWAVVGVAVILIGFSIITTVKIVLGLP